MSYVNLKSTDDGFQVRLSPWGWQWRRSDEVYWSEGYPTIYEAFEDIDRAFPNTLFDTKPEPVEPPTSSSFVFNDEPPTTTPVDIMLTFSEALWELKSGHSVARMGWNGKDMYLRLQTPDARSKITSPYIYIVTPLGDLVPWIASQTDLLAHDWFVVID